MKSLEPSPDFLTVAALARKLGVCADTVRRMDKTLGPLRTQGGTRLYAAGAVARARALLRGRKWYRRRRRTRRDV